MEAAEEAGIALEIAFEDVQKCKEVVLAAAVEKLQTQVSHANIVYAQWEAFQDFSTIINSLGNGGCRFEASLKAKTPLFG